MKKYFVILFSLSLSFASAQKNSLNNIEITNDSTSTNKTIRIGSVSFKMIKVEGGTFYMGSQNKKESRANFDIYSEENETPVHKVVLDSYYLAETEVSQELWELITGENPSRFKGKNKPVESISWEDICGENGFLNRLNQITGMNFSLPTEAQWEYAARGGNKDDGTSIFAGCNEDNLSKNAWYWNNSGEGLNESNLNYGTHPIKSLSPNELGLYDMSGNVWEWCSDTYENYSKEKQNNPTGAKEGMHKILRGGSWFNYLACRVACRFSELPSAHKSHDGLRLALPIEKE